MLPVIIFLTAVLFITFVYFTYRFITSRKSTAATSLPTPTPTTLVIESPVYTQPPIIQGTRLTETALQRVYGYPGDVYLFELPLEISTNYFEVRIYKYSIPKNIKSVAIDYLIYLYKITNTSSEYRPVLSDDIDKAPIDVIDTDNYISYKYKNRPRVNDILGWYIKLSLTGENIVSENYNTLDIRFINLGTPSPTPTSKPSTTSSTTSTTTSSIQPTIEPYIDYKFVQNLNNGYNYYNIVLAAKLNNTIITLSSDQKTLFIIRSLTDILSIILPEEATNKFGCIAISDYGNIIAYADSTNNVYVKKINPDGTIVDFINSSILLKNSLGNATDIEAIALSKDGSKIFISNNQYTAYLVKNNLSDNQYTPVQNDLTKSSRSYNGKSISVSLDDNILVIGDSSYNDFDGTTTIYNLDSTNGEYVAKPSFKGSSNGWELGKAVDNTNNTAVSGAPNGNGNKGIAYVYNNFAGNIITTPLNSYANIYVSNAVYQGCSVTISNDSKIIAIAANSDNVNKGAVFIYKLENNVYVLKQKIISPISDVIYFGRSIALSDNGRYLYVTSSTGSLSGPIFVFSIL